MPDFQYQPPTGPLSGSEFERQSTRFFQQVQGAADTAQSTAIVAQNTANEALERAQASNLVDGKTTRADAGGVNGPIVGSAAFLQVFYSKKDAFTKNLYQIVYAYSSARERMFLRQYRLASNDWSSWSEIVSSSRIGDGLTVNNGIISVPEYEGATASAAGISGLVPPAAAGQATYVLCGDGEWRDIATLVAAAQARIADKAAS